MIPAFKWRKLLSVEGRNFLIRWRITEFKVNAQLNKYWGFNWFFPVICKYGWVCFCCEGCSCTFRFKHSVRSNSAVTTLGWQSVCESVLSPSFPCLERFEITMLKMWLRQTCHITKLSRWCQTEKFMINILYYDSVLWCLENNNWMFELDKLT